MISSTINQKIAEALKAKDEVRLSTLRLLSSAFNYEKIAKQHDLSSEEELVVVKREAKKRQDAIESLKQAQSKKSTSDKATLKNRLEQEEKELAILKEFLPEEMPDRELTKLVENAITETGASSMSDMGRVIGKIMGRAKGRADGKKVSEMVRKRLG
jgi:uncharacterized protein YqeY